MGVAGVAVRANGAGERARPDGTLEAAEAFGEPLDAGAAAAGTAVVDAAAGAAPAGDAVVDPTAAGAAVVDAAAATAAAGSAVADAVLAVLAVLTDAAPVGTAGDADAGTDDGEPADAGAPVSGATGTPGPESSFRRPRRSVFLRRSCDPGDQA